MLHNQEDVNLAELENLIYFVEACKPCANSNLRPDYQLLSIYLEISILAHRFIIYLCTSLRKSTNYRRSMLYQEERTRKQCEGAPGW